MGNRRVVAIVLVWVPLVLLADTVASANQQLLLGLATWALFLVVLRWATPLVRTQALVVVAFATTVEYVFSGWLGVYVYRLDHVPAYVPPGHGLVYLAALGLGSLGWVRAHERVLAWLVAGAAVAYAAFGLSPLAARPDLLGAFWAGCLLGFLVWGRSRGLYLGAFVVVTYLELLGTHLRVWTWGLRDPTGLVSIGNPPSGAAGGYGWFDLVAVLSAPALLVLWRSAAGVVRSQPRQDVVVQQSVGAHRVPAVDGV